MERDFLGLMSSSSKDVCIDHGFKGSVGMQWGGLSNNKVSSLPHFMPFKPTPKEGPTKVSSSAFHSYGSTQKSFNLDRHGAHFSMPGCAVHATGFNEMRTFPSVFDHSIPMVNRKPFIKIHGGATGTNTAPTSVKQQKETYSIMGSAAGTYAPRSTSKIIPASAQLTIFYGGVVNVFDEVPLEKAQAIMLLAGNGSSMTANATNPRTTQVDAMSPKPTVADGVHGNQSRATSPRSSLSSPTSVTSHMGAQSRSGSISTDDLVGAKSLEGGALLPKAITPMESAFGTEMSSAIPIARKASLARFFEKRKERVTNASPYFNKSQHFEKHVTSFPSSW